MDANSRIPRTKHEYPLDDLGVTGSRLRGIRGRRKGRGRMITRALQPHPLHLSLLGLGELRRDYDQAKIDHEERTDLQTRIGLIVSSMRAYVSGLELL